MSASTDPTYVPKCAACGKPMPVATVARLTVATIGEGTVEVDPECHEMVRLFHPGGYAAPSGVRLFLRSHRSSL